MDVISAPVFSLYWSQLKHALSYWLAASVLLCVALAAHSQPDSNDAYEPNNDIKSAAPLPLNDLFTIQLNDDDEDWFVLDGKEEGLLIVHYEMPANETNPIVMFLKLNGENTEQVPFNFDDEAIAISVEKGKYFVNISRGNSARDEFTLRARYLQDTRGSSRNSNLFVIGMSLPEEYIETVRSIANIGDGKMLEVSSNTTNLALALASIREESRGNMFGAPDLLITVFDQVFTELMEPSTGKFSRYWLANQLALLAEALVDNTGARRVAFTEDFLALQLASIQQQLLSQKPNQAFETNYLARDLNSAMLMPILSTD